MDNNKLIETEAEAPGNQIKLKVMGTEEGNK